MSCGEMKGNYCSQEGVCPNTGTPLGQSRDCPACCDLPTCGELGGNYCSQDGNFPSGSTVFGISSDCLLCGWAPPPPPEPAYTCTTTIRDVNGNAVAGKPVHFALYSDNYPGPQITADTKYTGPDGVAELRLTAGVPVYFVRCWVVADELGAAVLSGEETIAQGSPASFGKSLPPLPMTLNVTTALPPPPTGLTCAEQGGMCSDAYGQCPTDDYARVGPTSD
jgi:hypothetical protein